MLYQQPPFQIRKQGDNEIITLTIHGKPKTIDSRDKNYNKVKQAIRKQDWKTAIETIDPSKLIYNLSDGRMAVVDGQVHLKLDSEDDFLVPDALNKKIIQFLDDGLPFEGLVKFALRLAKNPSKNSIEQLFSFIEHNNITICPDGEFIAYKKVRSNYLDIHSGTIDNSPGKLVEMPRSEVEDNPNVPCSQGLHAANWSYAQGFGNSSGDRMVYVKVDPADVVSVPYDYNHSKMRVCRYYVVGDCTEEFATAVYNSSLDDELDDEEDVDLDLSAESETEDLAYLKKIFPDEDDESIKEVWLSRDKDREAARRSLTTIRGNRTRRNRGDWD